MSRQKTVLIVDVSFLAWRAHYSTGSLSHEDNPTGVIYGVIAEIERLYNRFLPDVSCFCFDVGKPLRAGVLSTYKTSRKVSRQKYTEEQKQAYLNTKKQVFMLRNSILSELGFQNICHASGFEADDVIASIARQVSMSDDKNGVIVSSDEDLYQCISTRVIIYNPNKKTVINYDSFKEMYGLEPCQWADVKAIAGCNGDDVPGVPGIGNTRAIRFLQGKLKGKMFDSIVTNQQMIKRNGPLVSLPYENCPEFKIKQDKLSVTKWQSTLRNYGIVSVPFPGVS